MQDGSSSSVNDSPASIRIVKVRPHRNYGAGVVVSGETFKYRIERRVAENAEITAGEVFDRSFLQHLETLGEPSFCRADAIALLASREHSRYQIECKLAQRGYQPGNVAHTLDRLEEEHLLSDKRFAEVWIRSRFLRGGESRVAVLRGLASRGVNNDVAHAALAVYESDDPGCFETALQRDIEKLPERIRNDRTRAIRRLARKGYPVRLIMDHFP